MFRVPDVGEVILDRYEIRGVASEGPGYLTVHSFDRQVAVDVSLLWFRPGLFPDAALRESFVADAVAVRSLAHTHLRRLFEPYVDGDRVLVTAQVGHAAGFVRRLGGGRPADELDILRYASAIGQGLEAAHRVGTVHGYLVPLDVVEVAGQIKVTGVGLYRAASPNVARDLFWTRRRYIAPEVLAGQLPSPASDVFSLATILTELASGITGDDPADSHEAMVSCHLRLADVFARATRADPANRTQSVRAVLAEVRRHLIDDRVPTSQRLAMAPPPGMHTSTFELNTDLSPRLSDHAPLERADSESDSRTVTKHKRRVELAAAPAPPEPFAVDDEPDEDPTITRMEGSVTIARPTAPSDQDATTQYQAAPPDPDHDDSSPVIDIVAEPPPAFTDAPATILGHAPARDTERRPPVFVSRRSEEEEAKKTTRTPRTPALLAHERPDLKPRLRPLSEASKKAPAPSLGNYAPPRPKAEPRRRSSVLLVLLWMTAAIVAVLLGGLIALVVVRGNNPAPTPVAVDAAPVLIDASFAVIDAAPAGPCHAGMALVESEETRFCIDKFEAPGQGQLPATSLGIEAAAQACAERGARLCTSAEWQAGCRGVDDGSYPYGDRFEDEVCNVGRTGRGEIAPAGSFPRCVSRSGAFDMAGNVGEWAEGGFVHGGSAISRADGRCYRRFKASRTDRGYSDVGYRCCAEPLAPPDPSR